MLTFLKSLSLLLVIVSSMYVPITLHEPIAATWRFRTMWVRLEDSSWNIMISCWQNCTENIHDATKIIYELRHTCYKRWLRRYFYVRIDTSWHAPSRSVGDKFAQCSRMVHASGTKLMRAKNFEHFKILSTTWHAVPHSSRILRALLTLLC